MASAVPSQLAQGLPPLFIRNAKIVPVSGSILPKGSILVQDGLIVAVGESISAPSGAQIIEGEGLTVYPGLIDGLSTLGFDVPLATAILGANRAGAALASPSPGTAPVALSRGPEDRPLTTPWVKAADQVKPTDRRLPLARAAGFTSAVVFPTTGIFAGQGAVINLAGVKPSNMVVNPSVGMYTTMASNRGGGFPASLMGTIAYLRQTYLDANYYKSALALYEKNPTLQRPTYDRALEGIVEAPLTLFPATRAHEIDRVIRLSKEFGTKAAIYGLHEGFRRGDELAKSGVASIVNLNWPVAPRDQDPEDHEDLRVLELRDRAPSTPAVLAKAGAKFTFSSAGVETSANVMRAIKRAIDAGLAPADALRAMTLSAAEIYGVSQQLGSLEKGKIGNLTVTSGDLFQDASKVQFVVIDGVKYDPLPEEAAPARLEATR
ncbi:amidohydrolase family protein [Bryobacter aggregatus]|uniref:amidohydrolase family protein n=1 Tax=Bryobacter aggregatus TaxID=360054 RepID=UPI00138E382D|nr:amidohydrolase family protein [Bryobacter aggregatus]